MSDYVLGYVHKKSNWEKRRRKGSTVKRSSIPSHHLLYSSFVPRRLILHDRRADGTSERMTVNTHMQSTEKEL